METAAGDDGAVRRKKTAEKPEFSHRACQVWTHSGTLMHMHDNRCHEHS